MANPFFGAMGGTAGPQGGPMAMLQQFNKFRKDFQGDPKEEVQKLLASGRMSQAQLDQLQGMAKQFSKLLGQ